MNIKIEYVDSIVKINNDFIASIEIENKKVFYKLISDLYFASNNNYSDNITFFENGKEINMNNKIKIIVDYFDLFINSKKYIIDLQKYIKDNISDNDTSSLFWDYNRIIKKYSTIINKMDLPITIDEEISIENIIKSFRIAIKTRDDLLDNLLLLIDLEKALCTNNLLIFINLKQYLNKDELEELYKYAIYNNLNIMLINSQSYGVNLKNEKKIIIDEELEEYVL